MYMNFSGRNYFWWLVVASDTEIIINGILLDTGLSWAGFLAARKTYVWCGGGGPPIGDRVDALLSTRNAMSI